LIDKNTKLELGQSENVDAVFATLVDVLSFRAKNQANAVAYTFLVDGEDEQQVLTYAELHRDACVIAAQLTALNLRGKPALLLFAAGLGFVCAFFGALYAGVIAVPLYLPHRNRLDERLSAVIADCGARHALTSGEVLRDWARYTEQTPELAGVECIATDTLTSAAPSGPEFVGAETQRQDLAFLQYTSGSTGAPKGVMVTHGNLMANLAAIQRSFGHTEKLRMLGWLPLFHDMGLVGNTLQPLYVGGSLVFMSPVHFLQNPLRWLKAISKHRATTSGGPNFAYDYCVQRSMPQQRAGLDLSSWEIAFNGAEPVRLETLNRFAAAFETHGFRRSAFFPCYGMAETTLLLGAGERAGNRSARPVSLNLCPASLAKNQVRLTQDGGAGYAVVGCGQIGDDENVVAVDTDTGLPCPEDGVGEIWVACDSVALGYWGRPEDTQAKFHAQLPGSTASFLRTGDLGFVREREIFVTGRLKDLIVIRGTNHYPQDIERTVELAHAAVRSGCVAAFSVELECAEKLVIVLEIERSCLRTVNAPDLIKVIQKQVFSGHDLRAHAVCLLKPGGVEKTSSGKIRRAACRSRFLEGRLSLIEPIAATQAGAAAALQAV
jgi:acyl-CoA synthetase (AMP-forming)/AMP-acid ligase II